MGMILRIASSRIVGQGDIVGRSGYFSLNLSANSVMRGRLDARRTLKSLVADLRILKLVFHLNAPSRKISAEIVNSIPEFVIFPALVVRIFPGRPFEGACGTSRIKSEDFV
jgi:hypothetical protein